MSANYHRDGEHLPRTAHTLAPPLTPQLALASVISVFIGVLTFSATYPIWFIFVLYFSTLSKCCMAVLALNGLRYFFSNCGLTSARWTWPLALIEGLAATLFSVPLFFAIDRLFIGRVALEGILPALLQDAYVFGPLILFYWGTTHLAWKRLIKHKQHQMKTKRDTHQ